ncbi:MAG TPA: serine/threonine-protein kinase [Leptolyngbyaceae cyanobacterium]
MITLYCTEGHENIPGSRFCMLCGEQLTLPMANGIYPGQILGDRYLISRQLAQGGFGRTYLAEDTNRFNELCVLKEFAPQAQSNTILKKAEELFEREAGVLYKLEHPQIPRFRELFRVNLNGKVHLFLVQDYVEGETYRTLLETRLQQKKQFSEAEVIHLMLQILPVLSYIHALGVIHRDISPENLILRRADRLPMLIDFGGVKQVAATVVSQFKQPVRTNSPATLLGKVGYAPYEQIQTGIVYPHSDLYALAATVLVLLTGKEPQELIDERTLTWNWRREIHLSPTLGTLLDKMLSPRLSDRPVSGWQVLQALSSNNAANQHSTPPTGVTVAIAPANHPPAATLPSIPFPTDVASKVSSTLRKNWLVFPTAIVAVGVGWFVVSSWFQFQSAFLTSKKTPGTTTQKQASSIPTPKLSAAELQRKNQLRDRRQQLGINNKFYTALVDRAFWEKYSDRQGRRLSLSPEDEALRTEWDNIAAQQLDRLQALSPELRKQLGRYSGKERSRWRRELYKLHLSSRALYDLADAAFLAMFPQYKGNNYMNQPIAQVWYALADEKFKAILAGTAYEQISFAPGTSDKQVGGSLKPGEGKAYVAELTQEQMMKLDLQADPQVLISVYSPTGKIKLMEDSSDRAWSGKLPESGFYEFVVVSTASQPVDYQLKITAEPTS